MSAPREEEDRLDTTEQLRSFAIVHGTVQGVGLRYWTWKHAEMLGLAGSARNLDDGTVEVIAEGTRWAVRDLLKEIQGPDAPGVVLRVDAHFEDAQGDLRGFTTA
jgi:acylphosphatase